jgi:TusA-related sulfurtransferase
MAFSSQYFMSVSLVMTAKALTEMDRSERITAQATNNGSIWLQSHQTMISIVE